jgi:hypothetical protein
MYVCDRLRRRIALCIVDEAGQAIEPETLIPLTLDVTKLTLIGDPQQLPGYICSPVFNYFIQLHFLLQYQRFCVYTCWVIFFLIYIILL